MFRLYAKCPYCDSIFPSGFQAESPIQLIGISYLCKKCRRIFHCPPQNYLIKVDGNFLKAMKKEEVFALFPEQGVLIEGPNPIQLKKEVIITSGKRLGSYRAFVIYRGKKID